MNDPERRNFLRKIVGLTASAGVAGLLLNRLPDNNVLAPVQADGTAVILGQSNPGTNSTSLSASGGPAAFQATNTSNAAGLQGTCTAGTGVLGTTTSGTGVQGTASASSGTALSGFVGDPGAIPIVAQGTLGQTAHLQEWRGSSGTLSAMNAAGWLGLLTSTPQNVLHVAGTQTTESVLQYQNANGNSWIFWNDRGGSNLNFQYQLGAGVPVTHLVLTPTGQLHTGDIVFKNGITATEDGAGLAFKNESGEKIAVIDGDGNLHIKGKVITDL